MGLGLGWELQGVRLPLTRVLAKTSGPIWVSPHLLCSFSPSLVSVSTLSQYVSSYVSSLAPGLAIGAGWNSVLEECSAPMLIYLALSLNNPGLEAGLRADSLRSVLSLMSHSLLVRRLNPLQILHLSHT